MSLVSETSCAIFLGGELTSLVMSSHICVLLLLLLLSTQPKRTYSDKSTQKAHTDMCSPKACRGRHEHIQLKSAVRQQSSLVLSDMASSWGVYFGSTLNKSQTPRWWHPDCIISHAGFNLVSNYWNSQEILNIWSKGKFSSGIVIPYRLMLSRTWKDRF